MKLQSVRDVAASSRVDATVEVQALAAKGDYEDAAALKPLMDEEASARSVMEAAKQSFQTQLDALVAAEDFAGAAVPQKTMKLQQRSTDQSLPAQDHDIMMISLGQGWLTLLLLCFLVHVYVGLV